MVNSIRDKLDEADTISEIILILNHDKDKVCVVVEGDDDQKLFRPLLSNNSEVFQSYASNNGVDELVHHHFRGNKRVIGIRDRDYLSKPINEQCFFCDYSCAEMMIISVENCFDRLYSNFYKGGTMNSSELRLHCLERLEKLSKLRMLNYRHNWGINFKGIKPSKHYKININDMNKAIVLDINSKNASNQIDATREELYEAIPKCSNLHDYLSITNGHDFINLFCKVATGLHGQASLKEIAAAMRGTFGIDDFKTTMLYKNLLTYQRANNITIISEVA